MIRGLIGLPVLLSWIPIWANPDCTECHSTIVSKQNASHHAQALHRFAQSTVAKALLAAGNRRDGAYSYQYSGDTVTVEDPNSVATGTLAWAFGAGAQGMTPVGLVNGTYFEHRFSWYRALDGTAVSPGHPPNAPSMYFALGVLQSPEDARRCFDCHATGVTADASGNPDLTQMTPGVGCERCHGPGLAHVAAARAGQPPAEIRRAIFNSGRLTAKASIEVCGGCHRTPLPGNADREPEKTDPASVRFHPVGLLASKCFRVSGRLTCLTCHDPHDNAERSAAYYVGKCIACHPASPVSVGPATECRKNQKQDCLLCHMSRVRPYPHLTFTDHRIRVFPQ